MHYVLGCLDRRFSTIRLSNLQKSNSHLIFKFNLNIGSHTYLNQGLKTTMKISYEFTN